MTITNKDFVGLDNELSLKENLCSVIEHYYIESMLDGIIDNDKVDLFINDFLQSESEKILKRFAKKVKKAGGIGKVVEEKRI